MASDCYVLHMETYWHLMNFGNIQMRICQPTCIRKNVLKKKSFFLKKNRDNEKKAYRKFFCLAVRWRGDCDINKWCLFNKIIKQCNKCAGAIYKINKPIQVSFSYDCNRHRWLDMGSLTWSELFILPLLRKRQTDRQADVHEKNTQLPTMLVRNAWAKVSTYVFSETCIFKDV